MLTETIISALIPIMAEGAKQGIGRVFRGIKPVTIEDQIKLDANEIEKIKALALLDNSSDVPSQWVINLRASSRYIASWICIGIGSYLITIPVLSATGVELISISFGFLFGTRIVANWKK